MDGLYHVFDDLLGFYHVGMKPAKPLPPHVFAISDAAYRAMMDVSENLA